MFLNRVFSAIILGLTIFDSLLAHVCIHVAQRIYPYSLLFLVSVIISSLAGIFAIVKKTVAVSLIQNSIVILSLVLFAVTVAHWSGGDDGPGMILVIVIGPTLLMAALLALISTIISLMKYGKR
jgi:hypothetical protein